MKSSDLRDEALKVRARYDEEPSHSDHVADLARQLFEELAAWHRLDSNFGKLLEAAAILHDIGWSQTADGRGHHKHSARLIRDHAWQNLTPDEVTLVAQVARYHRKAVPQPGHDDFHALSEDGQKHVMILGGLLRLADALDRAHTGKILRIEAAVKDEAILIRVQSRGSWDAERTMFETKRDMLELASGRAVRVEAL
jgi:exopolyphosphatase/guanosine-5'-triphosphate,3'-diphosphate pyrophosphatase